MERSDMEGIDSREAARRCVEALAETDCIETRTALWKAAVRYSKQARMSAAGRSGEMERPPLARTQTGRGSLSTRELEDVW
jgi:hypothetical protein